MNYSRVGAAFVLAAAGMNVDVLLDKSTTLVKAMAFLIAVTGATLTAWHQFYLLRKQLKRERMEEAWRNAK